MYAKWHKQSIEEHVVYLLKRGKNAHVHLSHAENVSVQRYENLTLVAAPGEENSAAGRFSWKEIYILFYTFLYHLLLYCISVPKTPIYFKPFKRMCGDLSVYLSWRQGTKGENHIWNLEKQGI